MTRFIKWFNDSKNDGFISGRAALTYVYFESIHPFEGGNSRIGRDLADLVNKGILSKTGE